jgi:GNAT superfamily N-acetyltransferase
MIIRNAKAADAGQLVGLLGQLSYKLSLSQMEKRLKAYSKKGYQVIVAETSSQIIGFITVVCYELFVQEGRGMHIESLVVDERYRRQGVGRNLLQAAENFAQLNDCKVIEFITYNHRRADGTHAFYEHMGYEDHTVSDITYFSKELIS